MTISFDETSLREVLKRLAEGEKTYLENGSFVAKMIWLKNDVARLFLFPNTTITARGMLEWAVAALSSVVQADQLVFVMDSYGVTQDTRSNGEEWGQGGMEYAFVNKTVDAHLVHEQLTFTVASREGWCAMGGVPYVRHGDKIEFSWEDALVLAEDADEPGVSASGSFPEMMRNGMAADPTPLRTVLDNLGEVIGLSPVEREMHALCGAVKAVGQKTGMSAAIAATNEQELEILKRSFEGHEAQFVSPADDED
jgi:hypothetical protein